MSQSDYVISDQSGVALLTDLTSSLQALATNNSGPTQPSTTYPLMVWDDTTAGRRKQRTADDLAWVDIGPIAEAMASEADLTSVHSSGTGWVKYRDGTLFQYGQQALTTLYGEYNFPVAFASTKTMGSHLKYSGGTVGFPKYKASRVDLVKFSAISDSSGCLIEWQAWGEW